MTKPKRIYKKFHGSVGWLIFWIIMCWPVAIFYYFFNYE